MDARTFLTIFLLGALKSNLKTFPSAHRHEYSKDVEPLAKSYPHGHASDKDFIREKIIDTVARKYLMNDDDILSVGFNNDTLKATKNFIADLLNGSIDISGYTEFDIQERIKQLNKLNSIIEEIKDDLRAKEQLAEQSVNNKSKARYTTHFHQDFEENHTVYSNSLGIKNLASQDTSDIQEYLNPEVFTNLDRDEEAHITFQYDEGNPSPLSQGPHISESQTDIISDEKTIEYILSRNYTPSSTLENSNFNKLTDDDIESIGNFREISENKERTGITEIHSVGDTTANILSSTNIRISPSVFEHNRKGEHTHQLSSQIVISTGDTVFPTRLRQEIYESYSQDSESRSEETLMDSMTEASLSNLNDRDSKREFIGTPTSAAMPITLKSNYPILYKIHREHGRPVAPQQSVSNNYRIKVTEATVMDSMTETSLLSQNDRDSKSEFIETSTSAAMPITLKSNYPILYKIHREHGRSVAPQQSISNNNRIKVTEATLMDSMTETTLSSLNDMDSKSEFIGTPTSAAMPITLKSNYPILYKIHREHGRPVAPQQSVSNNYRIKVTSELRNASTLVSTKNRDRLVSDFSTNVEKTSMPPYANEESQLDVTLNDAHGSNSGMSETKYLNKVYKINPVVFEKISRFFYNGDKVFQNNTEPGTESTMIENVFSKAENALLTLNGSFQFLKNFFIPNVNSDRAYAKTSNIMNITDLLVHEDRANTSATKNFDFSKPQISRKLANFYDN